MAWSFNPFTGNLDIVGGGGTVVFEGEVETFDELPETVGDPAVGASYLVRTSSGVWLVNKRQSGIWIRRNNTGVRATDWAYGGDYPVTSVNGQTGAVSLTLPNQGTSTTDSPTFNKLTLTPNSSDSSLKLGTLEFQSYTTNNAWIGDNVYLDGATFRRRSAGAATLFYFQGDEGQFRCDASSSAGTSVTTAPTFKVGTGGQFSAGANVSSVGDFETAMLFCDGINIGLSDSSDISKKAKLDLSGIAGDTTRVLSLPNASGVIALQGAITGSGLTQATSRLLGRTTASTGAVEELTVGSGLTLASGSLTANFAAPPAIGSTTPAAGTFTSLKADSLILPSTGAPLIYLNVSSGQVSASSFSAGSYTTSSGGTYTIASAGSLVFNAGSTISGQMVASNGTLTASAPVLDLSQTWNNAAVTFTALQQTITNTASAVGSRLFNFVVGSTSAFSARIMLGAGPTDALAIGGGDRGLVFGNNTFTNPNAGFFTLRWQANLAGFNSSAILAWGADVYNLSYDLALQRDAADTFAQRRGTNAQTFRLYNTYTDASNYERGFMRWSSNVLQIGTEAGGTGSARNLEFQTGGTTRVTIVATTGNVACSAALSVVSNLTFQGNASIQGNIGAGILRLVDSAATSFDRLQFGGGTSSFPALKRSSTTLQARLADDSAFAAIQGKLTTDTAYTATTVTPTGYLTIYDSTGTAYKVPCVL